MAMSLERQVRAYISAVEGAAAPDEIASFYHPDAVMDVFPNRMTPAGARYDLGGILAASAAGQKLMSRQRFDVRTVTESGDRVVVEFTWSGELASPVGHMASGSVLKADVVQILEFEDGLIIRQRTYDCYDQV
jgi:ketosteroid isomerase-like protein